MCRKRTHEEFIEEVYKKYGNELTVKGKYINNKTKILVRHNKCECEWDIRPDHLLERKRCPRCSGNEKKTTVSFKKEVYEKHGNDYSILSEYKGADHKIIVKHNICGQKWEVSAKGFLFANSEKPCPNCNGGVAITHEDFENNIAEKFGNEYTVLGEYINARIPIKMKHNPCEYEFDIIPYNVLGRNSCPKCSKKIRKTTESFIEEIHNLVGNEYEVIGEYESYHSNISMKHNNCGGFFEMQPANFISGGQRCPICNESKGERAIADWLKKHNIKYAYNRRYKNCVNKEGNHLKFDFRLYKTDKTVLFIEYQGEQHDTEVAFWGGKEGLELRQSNDQSKRDYCKDNNIPLLEIWYWDFENIDQILNKKLLSLDLIKQENKEAEQLEIDF